MKNKYLSKKIRDQILYVRRIFKFAIHIIFHYVDIVTDYMLT